MAGLLNKHLLSKRKSSEITMAAKQCDEESISESWVELAPPSRGSLASSTGIDVSLLVDAQQQSQSRTSSGKGHSPKSLQSPSVELVDGNLEAVKDRLLAKEIVPPGRHTDWIWDWSSRPEATPPKHYFVDRNRTCSALTTPPNSPAPSPDHHGYSLRHSKLIRSELFRVEILFGIVVSNIVTFLLGACIGFCICKRLYNNPTDGSRSM